MFTQFRPAISPPPVNPKPKTLIPTIPSSGEEERIFPSLTSKTIGSLQSKQTVSIFMVLPGNNQQTASDSNAH